MSEARVRLDALPDLYPRLFPHGPLPWDFEVGDGWSGLVCALCARIDSILRQAPSASVEILQVKEKFGALRFYYDIQNAHKAIREEVWEAVALASSASAHVCERCGRPGILEGHGGWLATLCEACRASDP